MKEEVIKIIVDNIGVLISTGTTLLVAWIKKKFDLKKLRKQGRLIDLDKINYNGKHK